MNFVVAVLKREKTTVLILSMRIPTSDGRLEGSTDLPLKWTINPGGTLYSYPQKKWAPLRIAILYLVYRYL